MLDLLTVGPKFKRPACRLATAAIDRYLLPAPDLSSKPAAASRYCCCRLTGQTDRQTLNCFMVLTTYYVNVNVVSFLCCTLLFIGIIMFPFVVYFLQLSLTKILDCSKTSSCLKQVCVKLSTNADNVALPAFTLGCCSSRLISPACWAHSSKPQLQ